MNWRHVLWSGLGAAALFVIIGGGLDFHAACGAVAP